MAPGWLVPVVAAALTGVLSSGVTALYLRSTMPDVLAIDPDKQITPEQRHLAALLVAPAAPFTAAGEGKPVDDATLQNADVLGFQRGWTRTWQAPGRQRVEAFVLEFGDANGALTYARGLGRAAPLLTRPEPFTVTGVPGSSGLTDTVADKDGNYTAIVVVNEGRRVALLVFATRSATPGSAIVDLARRQWMALRTT